MDNEALETLMKDCLAKEKPTRAVTTACRGDKETLTTRKREARRAARELGYSQAILDTIENATTFGEIERALRKGREALGDHSPIDALMSATGRKKRKDYNR